MELYDYDLFLECLEDELVQRAGNHAARLFRYTVKPLWTYEDSSTPTLVIAVADDITGICKAAWKIYPTGPISVMQSFTNDLDWSIRREMDSRRKAECYVIRRSINDTGFWRGYDLVSTCVILAMEYRKSHPNKNKIDDLQCAMRNFKYQFCDWVRVPTNLPKFNYRNA